MASNRGTEAGVGSVTPQSIFDLSKQITVVTEGDDKGITFSDQISVDGEIIAGEDSYPVTLAFHCLVSDTSGTTITDASDVTDTLQSDSDSTTGLLGGTAIGSYILIGSKSQFEGVKLKITDSGTLEPANVLSEAYLDDTDTWEEVAFMATNSDYPHQSRAWNICYEDDTTQQVFFGFDPLTRFDDSTWLANTFNINGTDYEDYYWSRLRVETAITEDPTIEQIKLHTDRTEYEATGIFKYGKARNPIQLVSNITSLITNAQEDPANSDIEYTTTFTADTSNNKLLYNKDDGVGIVASRKFGLDTSVPLVVAISYYVDGTSTGDIEWTVRGSQVIDGYTYDGTNVPEDYTVIDTVSTDSNLVRRTAQATVPINTLESDSAVLIEISRLGISSANDTLSSNVVITNITLSGYAWKI